jgi:hypothetical protein
MDTLKPHGDTALSTAYGYVKAASYGQLEKVLYQVFQDFEARLRVMQQKIDEQEKTIKALTTTPNTSATGSGGGNTLDTAQAAPTSYASVVRAKSVSTAAEVLELIVKERRQASRKQTSVVISGLPEERDQAADLVNIRKALNDAAGYSNAGFEDAEYLADSDIRRASKAAAATGRPRLVFAKLPRGESEMVLEGARNRFKNSETYRTVFIRPCLTRHEVLLEYELRRERNERNSKLPQGEENARYSTDGSGRKWYWGVRWGELLQIDKDTRKAFKTAMP